MKLFRFPSITLSNKIALFSLSTLVALSALQLPAQEKSQAESPAASERRALDPMLSEERANAERLARADSRVKKLLGEAGIRVVSVEPVVMKPDSLEQMDHMARYAEVVLFRPEGELGARVTVSLQQNAVTQVHPLTGSQIPMTTEDLAEAFQLALRDSQVQKMLGSEVQSFRVQVAPGEATPSNAENQVTGLPLHSTDAKDPCSKHRCLELFFRRGEDFLIGPSVIADLTAKHIYVERRKAQ